MGDFAVNGVARRAFGGAGLVDAGEVAFGQKAHELPRAEPADELVAGGGCCGTRDSRGRARFCFNSCHSQSESVLTARIASAVVDCSDAAAKDAAHFRVEKIGWRRGQLNTPTKSAANCLRGLNRFRGVGMMKRGWRRRRV